MTWVIAAVFLAVTLLSFAALSFVFSEDRQVAKRLDGLTKYELGQAKEAQPFLKSFGERIGGPIAASAGRTVSSFGPKGYRERLKRSLAVAGASPKLTPDSFVVIKAASALILGAIVVLVAIAGLFAARWLLLLVPVALVTGFMAPNVWLRNSAEHRREQIRRDLPDMLDMLTISVEAGLGFDAALSKYVKNSQGVLALEFGHVLQEMQGGVPRREALRRLEARTDTAELNAFISAMIQADTLGTSVSAVLRTQASELRLRRRQKAEEAAQKLPVKMVFPVVLCILPATMIVVLGPAIIFLFDFFGG